MSEPQWLRLGREAAGRALYEAWHPLRTDNGCPDGSFAWAELASEVQQRYLAAGEASCDAFDGSALESARADFAAFRAGGGVSGTDNQ